MLDFFLSSLLVYQYWVFFFVTFFAAFGFPIPATALLLAGGAFLSQGYFEFISLFLVGFSGCILGDSVGYLISDRYGKDIFYRIRLGKMLHSRQFAYFEPIFQKHAVISVILTRFLFTGFGPIVNILAGLTHMSRIHFFMSDIFGEGIYIILFIGIGYSLGTEWESILGVVESFSTMLIAAGLILILLLFLKKYRSREIIR